MMEEKVRRTVEEIIGQMQCPKNFPCVESEFEALCKARDFGLEHYVECLEPEPLRCKFALSFGAGYLCQCPLRVYVSKNMNK
jgi:hypothetical protein